MKSDSNSSDFASSVLHKAKKDAQGETVSPLEEAEQKMHEALKLSAKQRKQVKKLSQMTDDLWVLVSATKLSHPNTPFG